MKTHEAILMFEVSVTIAFLILIVSVVKLLVDLKQIKVSVGHQHRKLVKQGIELHDMKISLREINEELQEICEVETTLLRAINYTNSKL